MYAPLTRQQAANNNRGALAGTRRALQLRLQQRTAMNRLQLVRRNARHVMTDRFASGTTRYRHNGWITYGGISNWRRRGIIALVTPHMIAAGGTRAAILISGVTTGYARGHLLAKSLGGSGTDPRNLVPLAHNFTNLQQFQLVEKQVLEHVLQHNTPAQRNQLGNVNLQAAKLAVNNPQFAYLHTQGYYHRVLYTVTPRYGRDNIHPNYLNVSAQCLTCGRFAQRALVIRNTIQ